MNVNDRRACGYSTRKRGSVFVLLHYGVEVGTGRDSTEIDALIDALEAPARELHERAAREHAEQRRRELQGL